MHRILAVAATVACLAPWSGCRQAPETSPPARSGTEAADLATLERFAHTCPYTPGARAPEAPDDRVNTILERLRRTGREDHLPLLLEYGLNVYWKNLQQTRLARELPVRDNRMLAELVRLAGIDRFTTPREGGWLDSQFYGTFTWTGYSSYQVYTWIRNRPRAAWQDYPNATRLARLLRTIDASGLNGIGGGGVCHYGCR